MRCEFVVVKDVTVLLPSGVHNVDAQIHLMFTLCTQAGGAAEDLREHEGGCRHSC